MLDCAVVADQVDTLLSAGVKVGGQNEDTWSVSLELGVELAFDTIDEFSGRAGG